MICAYSYKLHKVVTRSATWCFLTKVLLSFSLIYGLFHGNYTL